MALLTTTITIEIDDDLVKGLPAAQENLAFYTEEAIRQRLFNQSYMPDDVEINGWTIASTWLVPRKFNHAFDFSFEVISDEEDASDVTPEMMIDALRSRITRIEEENPEEMLEACGLCDTMEEGT